jgi:hypothetical protein
MPSPQSRQDAKYREECKTSLVRHLRERLSGMFEPEVACAVEWRVAKARP